MTLYRLMHYRDHKDYCVTVSKIGRVISRSPCLYYILSMFNSNLRGISDIKLAKQNCSSELQISNRNLTKIVFKGLKLWPDFNLYDFDLNPNFELQSLGLLYHQDDYYKGKHNLSLAYLADAIW